MAFDLIGDIHGCARSLADLLVKLGYVRRAGVYRHPERRVIFLGDFIDRGAGQREVIAIVRAMVDAGAALAVMGNHEYNAIAFATPRPDGAGFLRERSDKNLRQHLAFLSAYPPGSQDHAELIEWFQRLPLWLDLDGLRVVHACWDREAIGLLERRLGSGGLLDMETLEAAGEQDSAEYGAIETILKGREIRLPEGYSFPDKEGTLRQHIRVRWWDAGIRTYRDAFLGPDSAVPHIPEAPIDAEYEFRYGRDEKPCFLGHYWLEGRPAPLADNIACLDYSVARPGGKLCAYRWDGEQVLDAARFEWVSALDHRA